MPETRRYAYAYAEIDPVDNMCVGVLSRTSELNTTGTNFVPIPSYNEGYIMKYYSYDTQKWYVDAAFTTEWIPS